MLAGSSPALTSGNVLRRPDENLIRNVEGPDASFSPDRCRRRRRGAEQDRRKDSDEADDPDGDWVPSLFIHRGL